MKARVKATGEVVEVVSKVITSFTGEHKLKYVDQKTGISYFEEELFFPKDLADDSDYWTRLEHQYAGMAMQGILANIDLLMSLAKKKADDYPAKYTVAEFAKDCAHALVEKYKKGGIIMTRIEEIRVKAHELGQFYFPDECNVWARENIEAKFISSACIEMAEWMQRKMIEKAYEWIISNMPKYVKANRLDVFINNEDMANDFKRAMEE